MDLQAAITDLKNARLLIETVDTELISEKNDPEIRKLVEDAKTTESAIMIKLIDGYVDELEEHCGHGDPCVADLVHRWLGIVDNINEHDTEAKARWLDHLGTVASDIERAHREYQTMASMFETVKSNAKVHAMLTVKRIAATSAEKRLLPAYILALEAGGGARANEIYTAARKFKTN